MKYFPPAIENEDVQEAGGTSLQRVLVLVLAIFVE